MHRLERASDEPEKALQEVSSVQVCLEGYGSPRKPVYGSTRAGCRDSLPLSWPALPGRSPPPLRL